MCFHPLCNKQLAREWDGPDMGIKKYLQPKTFNVNQRKVVHYGIFHLNGDRVTFQIFFDLFENLQFI
jgi:hypothetical protein